jgi:hypothetical protein
MRDIVSRKTHARLAQNTTTSRGFSVVWDLMRDAAIDRHRFLNIHFEDSCPKKWAIHMAIVRAFYGW